MRRRHSKPRALPAPLTEPLEIRRLLSLSFDGTTIFIGATPGHDVIRIGTLYDNGQPGPFLPVPRVPSFTVIATINGVTESREWTGDGQIRFPIVLECGGGNDRVELDTGVLTTVIGGGGNDVIEHNAAFVSGGSGNDKIVPLSFGGGAGTVTVEGCDGNDTIWGSWDDDALSGGAGRDRIYGQGGNDLLDGAGGNDLLFGDLGGNGFYDDPTFDTLLGGAGHDYLFGGHFGDSLAGGSGNDHLVGEHGDDSLYGNAGEDTLEGGEHEDYLEGGSGVDQMIQ